MKRIAMLMLLGCLVCGGCRYCLPSEVRDGAEDMYVGARQICEDIADGAEADGTPVTEAEKTAALERLRDYLLQLTAFCRGENPEETKARVEQAAGVSTP